MGKLVHRRVSPRLIASPAAFARDWEDADLHLLDGVALGDVVLISHPPEGKCRVLNLWWDPDTEKLVVEYEDTPVP